MAWTIKCGDGECASETWTQNIDDLKRNHCDAQGWFLCGTCGSRGYIPKQYDLQEGGEPWKPYLKGIIQGRSKFGPLRRSKSRPVGEGVAVFVGRLERSLRSPFRAAQA